jgi:hypothetical protein
LMWDGEELGSSSCGGGERVLSGHVGTVGEVVPISKWSSSARTELFKERNRALNFWPTSECRVIKDILSANAEDTILVL